MTDVASLGIKVDTSDVERASKSLNELKDSSVTATTAVKYLVGAFGALKVTQYAQDSILLAARFETMGKVMEVSGKNAGYSAKQMETYSVALQKSGISMLQSRDALTQLATAQIDLAKAGALGRAAQDLAVVGNTNSSEAMSRLIHGIKSGQVEVLRTLGLNVTFEDSYNSLAKTLNKTKDKLTEQEKALARTNAVLEGSKAYAGIYEESMNTAGKAMGSLTRLTEDFKVKLGTTMLDQFSSAVFGAMDAMKYLNSHMRDVINTLGAVAGSIGVYLGLQFASAIRASSVAMVESLAANRAAAVATAQLTALTEAEAMSQMKLAAATLENAVAHTGQASATTIAARASASAAAANMMKATADNVAAVAVARHALAANVFTVSIIRATAAARAFVLANPFLVIAVGVGVAALAVKSFFDDATKGFDDLQSKIQQGTLKQLQNERQSLIADNASMKGSSLAGFHEREIKENERAIRMYDAKINKLRELEQAAKATAKTPTTAGGVVGTDTKQVDIEKQYLQTLERQTQAIGMQADELARLNVENDIRDKKLSPKAANRARVLTEVSIYKNAQEEEYKAQVKKTEGMQAVEEEHAKWLGNLDTRRKERAATAAQEQIDANEKVMQNFKDNVQKNVGDVLYNAMNGNFTNIGDLFKQMLMRMVADAAAANIAKAMFGGNTGGGGNPLSMILSAFIPKREFGGSVSAGQPYIVGEKRPEIFVPNQSGTIIPNVGGAGGGKAITINDNTVIQIDSRADRAQILSDVSKLIDNKQARLTDNLRRQGALA